jgi:hypothetical protein
VDARWAVRRAALKRTAKPCGPDAPWLASSLRMMMSQATVTKKVMDAGEITEQPLTPSRREGRTFGSNL